MGRRVGLSSSARRRLRQCCGMSPERGSTQRRDHRVLGVPVPDFEGLDPDEVRQLVDDALAPVVEPPYREEWWRSEIFEGQTPTEMLDAHRYRQLWALAEAFCDLEERDLSEIEQMRD